MYVPMEEGKESLSGSGRRLAANTTAPLGGPSLYLYASRRDRRKTGPKKTH